MKSCIIFLCLLSLLGCENNSTEPMNSTSVLSSVQKTGDTGQQAAKGEVIKEKVIKAKVIRAGLYKVIRSGGLINDPDTSTGKGIVNPVIQLVKVTDRIPLIKGAHMSLQYRIWNLPDKPAYIDLRRTLKHPPITLPNGKISTGSDYMIKGQVKTGQVIAYTGYDLYEDYELVEGSWVFEIWYRGKKLIEQKFTSYWPDKEEQAELQLQLKKATST